jgi:hypothetical protein
MLEDTSLPHLYSPIQNILITGLFLSTISLLIHLAVKRRTSLGFTADDGIVSENTYWAHLGVFASHRR